MKIHSTSDSPETVEADALAAFVPQVEEGEQPDARIDAWTGGLLAELVDSGEFTGKKLETALIHRPSGAAAARLLLVGTGKPGEATAPLARRAAAAAVRVLKPKGVSRLAVAPADPAHAQAIVEGVLLGGFETGVHKTEDIAKGAVEELVLAAEGKFAATIATGRAVASGQNFARGLANEPGNILTPTVLADRARAMAEEAGLEFEALDRAQMAELGMGALLGVAQGSAEEPRMIVVRYRPGKAKGEVHLGLVGKAVTFDTGGISIKPSADMDRMKYDMAGGAAVLGAMQAIAALKPAIPVTALIPSVENMPGSAAQRPGDVVRTMSGKTVEVLNTDAEGRLILADALTYAQKLGCNRLVDAATLTGAIVVALGYERAGLFANDDAWRKQVLDAAEATGERLWPMPLDEEYKDMLKSTVADLPNIGSRWGGAVTAAVFLKQFGDPAPWAHLDIAGTAWLEENKPEMPKGPTGVGVRTFVELARTL